MDLGIVLLSLFSKRDHTEVLVELLSIKLSALIISGGDDHQ